ncbi:MAG: 3'-5' exonuclease [Bdellovibrionaceae bacterium]|nr:3'-5' exonuclease [Pseudobdellovibrionaceae bacterium]
MRFIAFDLETTGTVPGVDKIVEIGAVRFVNGEVDALFSTLVDPKQPIPPGASAVNGITDEMVVGKPSISDLLAPFAEFCGDDLLVAHNAQFDFQFLQEDIRRFESPAPRGLVLDTLPLSRKVFPGLPNYKLGTLVAHLKIPANGFHRAEGDATYCGQMFLEILKRVSVGGQPPKLENLITMTGKPELLFPQITRQPKQLDLFGI